MQTKFEPRVLRARLTTESIGLSREYETYHELR